MKTLHLKLKKDVLIVDLPEVSELNAIGNDKEVHYAIKHDDKEKYTKIADGKEWKFLCKGEGFTEEIASTLVEKMTPTKYKLYPKGNMQVASFSAVMTSSALDSFISAIEASGHYWLVNPIKIIERGEDTEHNRVKNQNDWREAESKTFKNPLIFEIL